MPPDATGRPGRQAKRKDPQARRPAAQDGTNQHRSGVTGKGTKMEKTTAKAVAAPQSKTAATTLSLALAALLGLGIVTMAGHVQAAALHDAAHDVRHATGFPCH